MGVGRRSCSRNVGEFWSVVIRAKVTLRSPLTSKEIQLKLSFTAEEKRLESLRTTPE